VIAFLGSRLGQYLMIGGAVALAIGGALLWAYGQGEAAAIAGATTVALERAAAAARARAKVKPNDQGAMTHDPFNRDWPR